MSLPAPSADDRLPAGACDCHVHVIGPQERYPMVDGRHYTPGPAGLEALRAHLAGLGLQRAVIVQPSVYGTDNQCLLDALERMEGCGRGVAVPSEDASPAALREMHARGVRGVRINLESAGGRDVEVAGRLLEHWSARVGDLGWHLQLYAAAQVTAALADRLSRLPAPVVLDHFALAEAGSQDGGGVLTQLLRTGHVHVKLSAPYRLASPGLAARWARIFLQAAPHAVLWGSDWPHTAREPGRDAHQVSAYRVVARETLAATLYEWLYTPGLRQQVLADNPQALYAF
ncbi:MAG: amidohydrolase family protein [Pseudomonadota bacterium]|nr:amidohydrolase family protein [Pseudomonadota bacterium]